MELTQGVSVPIEKVQLGDLVHGLSDDSKGLTARPVTALLSRGERPCVELTFSNGRTLTCTSDHRILSANGQWVPAGQLKVGESQVSVGPAYPVERSDDFHPDDLTWSVDLRSSLGFVLSSATATDAVRARAFARLLGAAMSEASFSEAVQAKDSLCLRHQIDLESVRRDMAVLGLQVPDAVSRMTRVTHSHYHPLCAVHWSPLVFLKVSVAGL